MEAMLGLCTRSIFLILGGIQATGDTKTVVEDYIHSRSSSPRMLDLSNYPRPENFSGQVRLLQVSLSNARNNWLLPYGENISLES